MAEDLVLAFDVGGTHTRSKVGLFRAGEVAPHPSFPETSVRIHSKAELYAHVRDVLGGLGQATVAAAVFDIAGPVEGGTRARMTNWPDTEPITVDELVSLGLPRGRTAIMNDLFAGALGLVALLAREGASAPSLQRLHAAATAASEGHLVFVAPGTGLGSAGIVRIPAEDGTAGYLPVACEVQHTQVPVFDDDVAAVAEQVARRTGHAATWEDMVSGRGLALTHEAVCELGGTEPGDREDAGDAAAAVARRAAAGDEACAQAVDVYYRCVGRFAQGLALTFRPCAGVYLGGATTIKNRDLVEHTGFLRAFLDNPVQGHLLAATPVSLVLAELNLDGALEEASRLARRRVVVGTTG